MNTVLKTTKIKQFPMFLSGSAPTKYPTVLHYGMVIFNEQEALEIPRRFPFSGNWGGVLSTCLLLRSEFPMPIILDMVWLSIVEGQFYEVFSFLPSKTLESLFEQTHEDTCESIFNHIIVGMAPYGQVAVWVHGTRKSVLTSWLDGEPIDVNMAEHMPNHPDMTLDELCDFYINNDAAVRESLRVNGLPDRRLFDRLMAQYRYRYVPLFEHWHENEDDPTKQWTSWENDDPKRPTLQHIEQSLTDGTHDKMHDDTLFKHHQAGPVHRLAVRWLMGKSEWSAYLWVEPEASALLFERFCGTHRDMPFDILLHFDPHSKHYEVALFRHGMQRPQLLPRDVVQVLVFKDQFEHYRSDNYDQRNGSWLW